MWDNINFILIPILKDSKESLSEVCKMFIEEEQVFPVTIVYIGKEFEEVSKIIFKNSGKEVEKLLIGIQYKTTFKA